MSTLFDCSVDKASKIRCPVLVIHGTEDEVIDFTHGLTIYERCPITVEPLWVEGAGHNDVEIYGQYIERLHRFIHEELPNRHSADDSSSDTNRNRANGNGDTLGISTSQVVIETASKRMIRTSSGESLDADSGSKVALNASAR